MEKLVDHNKRERVRTIFCIAVIAAFLLSLVPLLLDARYNVPYSDDIENAEEIAAAWTGTHSLSGLLSGAAAFTRDTYETWQGTFASVFLMGLGCGSVFNAYPMLTPVVSFVMLLAAVWFANAALLKKGLNADTHAVLTVTFLEMLLFVQFCPSMYEGFFWFTSVALYLVCWCAFLTLLGVLLYQRDARSVGAKVALCFAALMLVVLIAGGSYTTLLPAGALLLAFALDAIRRKDGVNIALGALLLAAFAAGAALNILAPGNYARLAAESGAASAATSPVKAVIMSCVYALGEVLYRFDPAMLLFLIVVVVLTAPFAARSAHRFRMPWLVALATLALYAMMFVPLIYTKNNIGGLRVQNLYYFALYLLVGVNTAYCTGFFVKRAQGCDGGRAMPEAVQRTMDTVFVRPLLSFTVAVLLLAAVCFQRGILKTWSYAALQDVMSGTAQRNYSESMAAIARNEVPPAQLPVPEAAYDESAVRPNIAYGN